MQGTGQQNCVNQVDCLSLLILYLILLNLILLDCPLDTLMRTSMHFLHYCGVLLEINPF